MRKDGKMQKVVMSVLATMLVASLVLAVVSFVWPVPVSAEYWVTCSCGPEQVCEPGHWLCNRWYLMVHQGTGTHCTSELCAKSCSKNYCACP